MSAKKPTEKKLKTVGGRIPPEHADALRRISGPGVGAFAATFRRAIAEFVERNSPAEGDVTKNGKRAPLRAVVDGHSELKAEVDDLKARLFDFERRWRDQSVKLAA